MPQHTGTAALKSNVKSMVSVQFANYLLPLILIPYLTRTLGLDLYGIVAFGLGLIQLASVVTDFGFSLSATYAISKRPHTRAFANRMLGAVTICKLGLVLFVCVGSVLATLIQTKYPEHRSFFLLLLFPLAVQGVLPLWFFQGIERMQSIAVCTFAAKALHLLLVVLLVVGPRNYTVVATSLGASQLAALVLCLWLIRRYGYAFHWPRRRFVAAVLRSSTSFFWSRAAVAAFSSAGTSFLGMFSSPGQVAIYSAAEQLYKAGRSMVGIASQALYPYMARERDFTLLLRLLKLTTVSALILVPIGFLAGTEVLQLVFGPAFGRSSGVLKIFLLVLAVSTPSILLGYPLLGALRAVHLANRSVIIAGIFQGVFLVAIEALLGTTATKVALSVLAVEVMVLAMRIRWAIQLWPAQPLAQGA